MIKIDQLIAIVVNGFVFYSNGSQRGLSINNRGRDFMKTQFPNLKIIFILLCHRQNGTNLIDRGEIIKK